MPSIFCCIAGPTLSRLSILPDVEMLRKFRDPAGELSGQELRASPTKRPICIGVFH